MFIRKRLVILSLMFLLSGCASTGGSAPNQWLCAAAGALVGGVGAVTIGDADAGAAVASAAVGTALGYLACNQGATAAPAPAPQPAPAPAPAPEPEKDSDGDGVLDNSDDCPGTPRGTPVDARGCPEIPDLRGVHFNFDKDQLTPEGEQVLDAGIQVLNNNPQVRVEIVGHTDAIGTTEYNQGLSERRAETVRAYLASHGVSDSRLSASGRGENEPVADNETKEGRAQNRRVDLTARPM